MHAKQITTLTILGILAVFALAITAGCTGSTPADTSSGSHGARNITDSSGRVVTIPGEISRTVCTSGGTCVRYLTYLGVADRLVAVETGEQLNLSTGDSRAYVWANPGFASLPSTGSSRGVSINLEQVVALDPQVIMSMGSVSNTTTDGLSSADTIQIKTGIPVISVSSGSFQDDESKEQLYATYRLLGTIYGKEERAENLIAFTDATIADLMNRTADIPESQRKSAYIGGLSHGGAHGLMSTQSDYMPFIWNNIRNIANGSGIQNADFSKEGLIYADPDVIFIDAGTLGVTTEIGGFQEIKSPVYSDMKAVKNGQVYATLPYTGRSTNLETQLVDAYYIGKVVYPDRFADIDPKEKADEIYAMYVGVPVFEKLNANCDYLAFEKVPLNTT